jgi:hypothetical protein
MQFAAVLPTVLVIILALIVLLVQEPRAVGRDPV